jgi:cytochrome b subunit of formate dehydrogenase
MQKQKKYWANTISAVSTVFTLLMISSQTAFGQWNVDNYNGTNLPKTQLSVIIQNVAFWLLAIFGFIAVIGFIISGILYLVSSGDENMQEQAKRAMIYSITGVIVGLAGLVVIYAVDYFLKGSNGSAWI